jgi:hypothetical protein
MRKRFHTPPPSPPDETAADGALIGPEETTHRYFSNAIEDIRQAITQARAAIQDAPLPPVTGAPEAGRRWASELPPMAATEASALSEVTQRYADQSVAGIRAAIAAAKGAETEGASARRFALGAASEVKVPSMVIPAEPAAAKSAEHAAREAADKKGAAP